MTFAEYLAADLKKNPQLVKEFHETYRQNLTLSYHVETKCDDCGEDIEEPIWTNEKNQIVHISTGTQGYYYNDGTVRCEACHDGNI
jgi:hypothetical protein